MKYPWLDSIVGKMTEVPRLNEMADVTGITWAELQRLVREKLVEWGHGRGQDLLNLVMLGAAIGYMYAKGDTINGQDTKYPS